MFKKYNTLLFFILASTCVYAQKDKNLVLASVTYIVINTTNEQIKVDDICILEIGKTQSFFYSKNIAENGEKMAAAFENAKITGVKASFNASDFVIKKLFNNYKLHSFQDKQTINIQSVGGQMLGYVNNSFTNNWKILEDTATINIAQHLASNTLYIYCLLVLK